MTFDGIQLGGCLLKAKESTSAAADAADAADAAAANAAAATNDLIEVDQHAETKKKIADAVEAAQMEETAVRDVSTLLREFKPKQKEGSGFYSDACGGNGNNCFSSCSSNSTSLSSDAASNASTNLSSRKGRAP